MDEKGAPQAEQDVREAGVPWMATDELAAFENAVTGEAIQAVHAAIGRRRRLLNDVDRARIARHEWEHEAIQAIFDRVGLALDIGDD
ncbi:hypothetical protein [Salinisphaera orenii]|uniref:hypothetical protein n=1 Tax=Salinisphaera orenii TaxID=856731 RepID=UPI000DBE888B